MGGRQPPVCALGIAQATIAVMPDRIEGHGGDLIAEALRANGVDRIYTLSGGHIFPIYDGAHTRGIRIVDTRHEQAAAFAAEAHGKLSREPGVVALTAGPGVVNGMNAVVSAYFNGSPMLVLGGRAPQLRWGQGSLQEMDHVPLVATVSKHAATVHETGDMGASVADAIGVAASPHRGPVFLDFPMDALFSRAEVEPPDRSPADDVSPSGDLRGAAKAYRDAERPVLLIGSDVWMNGAAAAVRSFVERTQTPAFMNGMGRGVLPADHGLAFNAARGHAFARADLVLVIGTPLDFRLGFGKFGDARVVHVVDDASQIGAHADPVGLAAPFAAFVDELTADPGARDAWVAELRAVEGEKRAAAEKDLHTDTTPIHPARIYGELAPLLPRDAIVIADGGDFASYAGKYIDVWEPGGWLDPGPYGCLGISPGYALAAGLLHPGRRVVVFLGDGAAGFGMGDWDTLIRFGIDVTFVCGNNGIWGLEKHPMQFLYGYDVAADLRPETRYDEVMRALGGHGELVTTPTELGPALARALATEGPSLVNVVTDPAVAYPRSANLA